MGKNSGLVLVVDDYDDSRATLREALEEMGHDVVEAANGQDALDFLIFHSELQVDLIILDLDMPVMNGWQLMALLRSYSRLSTIPVVVVSAQASRIGESERRWLAGCVQAPYDVPKLQALVRAIAAPANPAS
jgi:CheY-like chemotaxis protein